MKKTITLLIIFMVLLHVSMSYAADQDITLKQVRDKNVIVQDIGNNEIVMVIMTPQDGGSYWFLLKEFGNFKLGENLSSFYQVDCFLASPDGKYLAVTSVGEGHPLLEVVDLEVLRKQGKYKVLQELNPYPGVISILHWDDSQLILSSDAPLDEMKKGLDITTDQLLPEDKPFSLNIATGAIKRVTEKNPLPGTFFSIHTLFLQF